MGGGGGRSPKRNGNQKFDVCFVVLTVFCVVHVAPYLSQQSLI